MLGGGGRVGKKKENEGKIPNKEISGTNGCLLE